MHFRILIALAVFLGSYLPLSMILLIQDYEYSFWGKPLCLKFWSSACVIPFKNPAFALGFFMLCVICFLITLGCLSTVNPKHSILIKEAKHVPSDIINYTLPYVVSFMSIDYHEIGKFLGFLIFLGWMFWITYRSGQIILNPLLIVFGWKIYETSYTFTGSTDSHNTTVLSKGSIEAGRKYLQIAVQDILVIKNTTDV